MANLSSKYYQHITCVGGLNECIKIRDCSVLPNCVGYAWGRVYEVTGKRPNLSLGNAKDWFDFNDGYERGTTPKVGAVGCFKGGTYGHVVYVEELYSNGDIKVSESVYNGQVYTEKILYKSQGYAPFSGYVLQGFIYTKPEPKKGAYKGNSSYDLCVDIGLIGKTKVATRGYFTKDARRLYLQANSYEHKHDVLISTDDEIVLTSYIGIATSNGVDIRVPAFHVRTGKVGYVTLNYNKETGTDFHASEYIPIDEYTIEK